MRGLLWLWLTIGAAALSGCGPAAPDALSLGARVAQMRSSAGAPATVEGPKKSVDGCADGDFEACELFSGDDTVAYSILEGAPDSFEDRFLWHRRQCERGVARACDNLGVHRLLGEGAARDLDAAEVAFERAVALGYPLARVRLGRVAQARGQEIEARRAFRTGCTAGLAEGCLALGDLLERGAAGSGLKLFREACASGSGAACAKIGRAARRAGEEKASMAAFESGCAAGYGSACAEAGGVFLMREGEAALSRAHELLIKACERGSADGCRDLAELHRKGRGTEIDAELAGSLLRRGCRLGDGHSCSRAARMYQRGRAVPRDPAKAIALFSRACAAKRPKDCLSLGLLLETDRLRARAFNGACVLGSVEGCARLGLMQINGTGIAPRPQEGLRRLEEACEAKSTFACVQLELAYRNGAGVPADAATAARYAAKACALGRTGSCRL